MSIDHIHHDSNRLNVLTWRQKSTNDDRGSIQISYRKNEKPGSDCADRQTDGNASILYFNYLLADSTINYLHAIYLLSTCYPDASNVIDNF